MNGVTKKRGPGATTVRRLALLFVATAGFLASLVAVADENELATGTFVVSLAGEDGQRPWVVKALEQNIYNDLSGYARFVAVQKATNEAELCPRRKVGCMLELYALRDIDALLLGHVDRSRIEFAVYDVRNRYLVNTGSVKIGSNATLLDLRLGAFKAFKIFIEKGGILDDRADSVAATDIAPTEATADDDVSTVAGTDVAGTPAAAARLFPPTAEFRRQLLVALAGLVFLPFLLATFGRPLTHPDRPRFVLRWCLPFMAVSLALIGLQYWMEVNGGGNVVTEALRIFDDSYWILAGLGGALWGSFLVVNFRLIVPHLAGVERIEKENLLRLLRSCLVTMSIKTAMVAFFYAAVFLTVLELGAVFSYSRDAAVLIVFPLTGLFVVYWMALLLDVFAMSNDVKLAGKRFVVNSEWNLKVRKYFTACLKRNGITLDDRLVDELAFIAGQHEGVVSYRGGFGRPRIAIQTEMLIFALGDIDETDPGEAIERYYDEREDVELRQHGVFRIAGGAAKGGGKLGFFRGRADKRRAALLEETQARLQRALDANRANRGAIAGSGLAAGVVRPPTGSAVPALLANGPRDVDVMDGLFEDYAMRHRHDADEAEVDDSSEFDRDFLFGALLHHCGSVLRYDTIGTTIRLYFARMKNIREGRYGYPFSKHFALVADTFVVLNFGLNHLIQYLFYRLTKDTSFLTTKGVPGYMLENQAQILANAKTMIGKRKPPLIRTDELDRIAWLSRFTGEAIHRNPAALARRRRVLSLSVTGILASLAFLLIFQAYDYHPTYLEIIETEQRQIDEALEARRENERKQNDE